MMIISRTAIFGRSRETLLLTSHEFLSLKLIRRDGVARVEAYRRLCHCYHAVSREKKHTRKLRNGTILSVRVRIHFQPRIESIE